jgi:hypothetical protein
MVVAMRWMMPPYFVAAAILTAQSPILAQPAHGDPAAGRQIAIKRMPSRSPDDPFGAIQSSSWVAHRLTRINETLERLAGLPCWQPAVLNARYDWLLFIGEWALIRRRSN